MKSVFSSCFNEFKLRNCGFQHLPPEEFVKSQWQTCSQNTIFLIYRWLTAIFFIIVVGFSLADGDIIHWYIYLTHWGIALCLITTIFGAILTTMWHYHPEFSDKITDSNEMPNSFKIYWAIHNSTLILSMIISIVYWGILYNDTILIDAPNIMTHITNSVLMFIDLLIVAYPIRLYHVIQPILLGIIYILFTVVYYYAGGKDKHDNNYIYSVLNWDKPNDTIIVILGILGLAVILHIFVFLIYKLRTIIYAKYFSKSSIIPTSVLQTSTANGISMIFGNENRGFNGSTDKIVE